MITRAEVDALRYGDVVRLEMDTGEVYEGPVTGLNGYKEVAGRALRLADSIAGQTFAETIYVFNCYGEAQPRTTYMEQTGYPNYVLNHGTLTILERKENQS